MATWLQRCNTTRCRHVRQRGGTGGETDPKLLMRQQADEWAETELQRRGGGQAPDAVVELLTRRATGHRSVN